MRINNTEGWQYCTLGNSLRQIRKLQGQDTMWDTVYAMAGIITDRSIIRELSENTLYNYVGQIERGPALEAVFSRRSNFYVPRIALYAKAIGLDKTNLERNLGNETDIGSITHFINRYPSVFPLDVLYKAFPGIWIQDGGLDCSDLDLVSSFESLSPEGQEEIIAAIGERLISESSSN